MQTPGAAMSMVSPKLLKLASVSSWSLRQVAGATPPPLPSKSAMAETQMAAS